ncbi:MAG: hypothetical protein H0W76_04950 [Pyrinomonadaceae bacterium]|nr:hypothetical protein [Pyrinomonadaceae bacterium]
MSYIIDGAQGQDWQGANWVFLSMSEPLLAALQEIKGAEPLAERLAETMNAESGYLDISDLLESPKMNAVWLKAVDDAIARMRERGSAHWHRPEEFEPFLEKVAKLKNLALVQQPV